MMNDEYSSHSGNVDISIDLKSCSLKRIQEAQSKLNQQIVADCTPLIPYQQGALRNSVRYPQGISGGEISWNTPYAHYQYEGVLYGPSYPIKDAMGNLTGFYSPPNKYPTGRALQYSNPGTGSKWFERAKTAHKDDWIKLVGDTMTGA